MRIIVMLNPTNLRGTKTAYTKFRQCLKRNGFQRMQPEIYMRVVTSRNAARSVCENIEAKCPDTGVVRLFQLTESQFARTKYLAGDEDDQERLVGSRCLVDL